MAQNAFPPAYSAMENKVAASDSFISGFSIGIVPHQVQIPGLPDLGTTRPYGPHQSTRAMLVQLLCEFGSG